MSNSQDSRKGVTQCDDVSNSSQDSNNGPVSLETPASCSDSHNSVSQSGTVDGDKASAERELLDSSIEKTDESKNSSRTDVSGKSRSAEKKKKGGNWYSVLSPTYKSKSEDFKRLFKVYVPPEERLVVDYSCALQKDILVHGRLYVCQNWLCFYANIFRWETILTIKCSDITSITKEKTARLIPNAIQICTKTDRYFLTSFAARDKTFLMLFRVWQNALLEQPMSAQELWQWVHYSYGEELGLTSSDDDYVKPSSEETQRLMPKLTLNDDKTQCPDQEGLLDESVSTSYLNGAHSAPEDNHINIVTDSYSEVNDIGAKTLLVPNLEDLGSPAGQGEKDLPTDLGDTTEEEEGEVQCGEHDHSGVMTLDDTFNLNIDQVFEYIFTESEFIRRFTAARKTTDLVQAPWPEEYNADGNKERVFTYTLSLNYSIGPKHSPSIEKQTMYGQYSQPGAIYIIDAEVTNGGVPYGDNFYCVNRYCLTRVSSRKTRMKIHSEIKYRKSVWGLVKNFIEKNAFSGLEENFTLLAQSLREETEKNARLSKLVAGQPAAAAVPKKKVLRKRRCPSHGERPSSAKKTEPADATVPLASSKPLRGPVSHSVSAHSSSKEDQFIRLSVESLVRVICFGLIILVMFNAVLFYKLYSLESKAGLLHLHRSHYINNIQNLPKTKEEWTTLLHQQKLLHEAELARWRDILSSSISLVEQMKNTLIMLEKNIQEQLKAERISDDVPR